MKGRVRSLIDVYGLPALVLAALVVAVATLALTDTFAPGMEQNLWAEFVGLAAGSAITYFVIDHVVRRNNENRWSPLAADLRRWIWTNTEVMAFTLWSWLLPSRFLRGYRGGSSTEHEEIDLESIAAIARQVDAEKKDNADFYTWLTLEKLAEGLTKHRDTMQTYRFYLSQTPADPDLLHGMARLDRSIALFASGVEVAQTTNRSEEAKIVSVARQLADVVDDLQVLRSSSALTNRA